MKSCLRGDPRNRRDQGARPHHRRRLHRQHSARAARRHSASASISRGCRCAGVQWLARAAASPSPKCCDIQLRHRHGRDRRSRRGRAGHGSAGRRGETVALLGEVIPAAGELAWSTTATSTSRGDMKRRAAILISGRGSNMAALIDAAKARIIRPRSSPSSPTAPMPSG